MDFSSSNETKTPNQVAHKWKEISRIMKRDLKKLKKTSRGARIISKEEWILQTLKSMNEIEDLGIGPKEIEVLLKS